MKTTAFAALALAGGLAALAPAASIAQPAPTAAAAEHGRGHAKPMRQGMSPEQRMERRSERLRTVLQLQPGQEAALRSYVAALTPGPEQRAQRAAKRQDMTRMTTPQRLDARKARMAERMAMFERRAEATKRFYAQLTPGQQKAFDAMPAMGDRRGMRGPHRGGHGPGGRAG